MRFLFQKLYADVVTPDGTACIAYVSSLDAWGLRSTFAGLEVYWPDGLREVARARPHAERVDPRGSDLVLSFDVAGGPFVLALRTTTGPWAPQGPPPCDGLRWSVRIARAEAVGRWLGDARRPVLRGVGYADSVELHRPPRAMKLGLLQWGRVHFPRETLIFSAIDFPSGRTWRRAAQWSERGMAEWSAFAIDRGPAGAVVRLPGQANHLSIAPGRALHVGAAVDAARFPGVVERIVSSALAGPAIERRALGLASWTGARREDAAWALNEAVRFGTRPSTSAIETTSALQALP
jgi:hypothetical protein